MTPVLSNPRQEEERLNRICEMKMECLDDYHSLMDKAVEAEAVMRKAREEILRERAIKSAA